MAFICFFAVGLLFVCMFSMSFGAMATVLAIGAIAQQWGLPILTLLMAWLFIAVSVEALR